MARAFHHRRLHATLAVGALAATTLIVPATARAAAVTGLPEGAPPTGTGGAVAAWGADDHGQTDVPASVVGGGVVAVSAGFDHSLALRDDGTVVAWGADGAGQTDVPAALSGQRVTAVAAGASYSLALTSSGTVVAWGDDSHGQTDVPAALSGTTVTAIAAGTFHALAVTSDGTVVGWGDDSQHESDAPPALAGKRVVSVAAGNLFSVALTAQGQVISWGIDSIGQTDVPASLTGRTVTAIATGTVHTLALTSDGAVVVWGGFDDNGNLDVPASLHGKTVVAVAGGTYFSLALTSDGTVTAWGRDDQHQTDVPAALAGRVHAISGGGVHALAVAVPGGDTRAPVITVPRRYYQARATSSAGAVVDYVTPTAVDDVDGPVPVRCAPPSGSRFPLGPTTITCTASDAAGNTTTESLYAYVRLISTRVQVTRIDPRSGPVGGGTRVVITGHGFTGATSVLFGASNPPARFTVKSDRRIVAISPPSGRTGFVHVTVHGQGNSVGTERDRFHYLAASS